MRALPRQFYQPAPADHAGLVLVASGALPVRLQAEPALVAISHQRVHLPAPPHHAFADQPRLTARALEIADRSGARIIRVFSYWRTMDPDACFSRIVEALRALSDQAARHNLIIGLENEHACNIATGAETARVLAALDHPNLKVVWDPANAVVSGEKAFPEGYGKLPVSRIQHVHAKDCTMDGHTPLWCAIGDGVVGWRGQVDALVRDGYKGWLSLETHWPGPGGNKHEASMICGRRLVELAQ